MTITPTHETRLATGAARAEPDFLRSIPVKQLPSDFTDRLKLLAVKKIELEEAELMDEGSAREAARDELGTYAFAVGIGVAAAAAAGVAGAIAMVVRAVFIAA